MLLARKAMLVTASGGGVPTDAFAHYTMDSADISGSTLVDVSGNGNNGTIVGATTTPGVIGEALEFIDTGLSTTADRINTPQLIPTTGDWTIAIWAEPDTINSGSQTIIYQQYNDPTDAASGRIQIGYDGLGNARIFFSGTNVTAPSTGAFELLVFKRSGSTISAQVNNGTPATGTQSANVLAVAGVFGARPSSGSYTFPFYGKLDQFQLFNRALTTDEISALYAEGTP